MFVFICNWRVSSILPLTWTRKRRYISRNVKLAKHVINPESGLFAFREASAPSCSAVCAQLLFRTVLLKHVLARRHVFWFVALNKNNAVIITDTNSPRFPRFKFRLSRSSPALFLTSLSCSPVLAFIYLPPRNTRTHEPAPTWPFQRAHAYLQSLVCRRYIYMVPCSRARTLILTLYWIRRARASFTAESVDLRATMRALHLIDIKIVIFIRGKHPSVRVNTVDKYRESREVFARRSPAIARFERLVFIHSASSKIRINLEC